MHLLTLLHLRRLTWFCKNVCVLANTTDHKCQKTAALLSFKKCIKKNLLRSISNISNISNISSAGLTLVMCLTYEIKRLKSQRSNLVSCF